MNKAGSGGALSRRIALIENQIQKQSSEAIRVYRMSAHLTPDEVDAWETKHFAPDDGGLNVVILRFGKPVPDEMNGRIR